MGLHPEGNFFYALFPPIYTNFDVFPFFKYAVDG
jgi:hypothetical protein